MPSVRDRVHARRSDTSLESPDPTRHTSWSGALECRSSSRDDPHARRARRGHRHTAPRTHDTTLAAPPTRDRRVVRSHVSRLRGPRISARPASHLYRCIGATYRASPAGARERQTSHERNTPALATRRHHTTLAQRVTTQEDIDQRSQHANTPFMQSWLFTHARWLRQLS